MATTTARPVTPDAARACPGVCNAGWRRDWSEHNAILDGLPADAEPPAPPTAEPTVGDPVWCSRCVGVIRRALADLDDLAALLEAENDGHRPQKLDPVPVTSSRTIASPSTTVDTLDVLFADLVALEDYWRDARGYPTRPQRGRGAHARTSTVAWLLGQLSAILGRPDSVAFGADVLAWQRRLQAATRSQPDQRRPGRCPRCAMKSLFLRADTYTECRGCGFVLSEADYAVVEAEHRAAAGKIVDRTGAA